MDLKLLGKRAIVTGGSRGIGKAIARMLTEEGVTVVIASRGRDALDATAEELTNETGSTVTGVVADTGSDDTERKSEAMLEASLDLHYRRRPTTGGHGNSGHESEAEIKMPGFRNPAVGEQCRTEHNAAAGH